MCFLAEGAVVGGEVAGGLCLFPRFGCGGDAARGTSAAGGVVLAVGGSGDVVFAEVAGFDVFGLGAHLGVDDFEEEVCVVGAEFFAFGGAVAAGLEEGGGGDARGVEWLAAAGCVGAFALGALVVAVVFTGVHRDVLLVGAHGFFGDFLDVFFGAHVSACVLDPAARVGAVVEVGVAGLEVAVLVEGGGLGVGEGVGGAVVGGAAFGVAALDDTDFVVAVGAAVAGGEVAFEGGVGGCVVVVAADADGRAVYAVEGEVFLVVGEAAVFVFGAEYGVVAVGMLGDDAVVRGGFEGGAIDGGFG